MWHAAVQRNSQPTALPHSWGRWHGSPCSAATGWHSQHGTDACRAGSESVEGGGRETACLPQIAWEAVYHATGPCLVAAAKACAWHENPWPQSAICMLIVLPMRARLAGLCTLHEHSSPAHLGAVGKGLQADAAQRLILLCLAALALQRGGRWDNLQAKLARRGWPGGACSLDAAAARRVSCCRWRSCCADLAAGAPSRGPWGLGRAQLQLLRCMYATQPACCLLNQHWHAAGRCSRLAARCAAARTLAAGEQALAGCAAGGEAGAAAQLAPFLSRRAVHMHRQLSKLVLGERWRLRLAGGACGRWQEAKRQELVHPSQSPQQIQACRDSAPHGMLLLVQYMHCW